MKTDNNKMIKACIFDLDGVIVDTAKYHYIAWKRLANEMGFDFTEEDNERLKGVSRVRSLEIILEIGSIQKTKEEQEMLATQKNDWYVEYIVKLDPEEILPGVSVFLKEIKAKGIKTALGSASKNARLILDRLNLTSYFDAIVDGKSVSKAKPDPEVFLKGAEDLGLQPAECLVFEDAQAGVDAAKNGNMPCVGIGAEENLKGADYVMSGFDGVSFDDLLKKLNEENKI